VSLPVPRNIALRTYTGNYTDKSLISITGIMSHPVENITLEKFPIN